MDLTGQAGDLASLKKFSKYIYVLLYVFIKSKGPSAYYLIHSSVYVYMIYLFFN